MNIETIKEEFREFCNIGNGGELATLPQIEAWIFSKMNDQLLSLQEEVEERKEERDIYSPAYVSGFNDALDKVLEIIKSKIIS